MEKYLIIDSRPYGLFSIFLHTIDCLKWSEENKYIPFIRWGNGRIDCNIRREGAHEASLNGHPKFVLDKENFVTQEKLANNAAPCLYIEKENDNVWEYYFEPINKLEIVDILTNKHKIADIFMCGELDFDLNNKFLIRNIHSYDSLKLWSVAGTTQELQHREEVYRLINRYVKITTEIQDKINSFYNKKFNDAEVVYGIHVRGTDKKSEYPFKELKIEDYIKKINDLIIQNNDKKYKIYIASDNNESILQIANFFGKEKIICHPSIRMNSYNSVIPIHLSANLRKRLHGEQTLIEMLLLSKCDYIVGTDSNFTAPASFFNPDAKLVYLNRIGGEG